MIIKVPRGLSLSRLVFAIASRVALMRPRITEAGASSGFLSRYSAEGSSEDGQFKVRAIPYGFGNQFANGVCVN